MTEAERSLATRGDKILAAEIRLASSRKNDPCTAFIETAKKVVAEYPDLSPTEKQVQYNSLNHEIEMMNVRMHQDCSRVLDSISKILGISSK
jgi:hypothetical protein